MRHDQPVADPRIEKWERWFEHGITNDLYTMHLERFAWKRMEEIARENPDLNGTESYLWEFLFDIYAKTQAAAVRRQADTDPQAASLGRLIWEVEKTPDLLTRDWWIGLWKEAEDDAYWKQVAEKAWADQFAGTVGDHMDPAVAAADLAKLRDGSRKVKEYVDQNVAHLDARTLPGGGGAPPDAPKRKGSELTLNEVHDAIDLIGDLFKKYGNLLTAAAWADLTPAIQHDWEAVFRVPWIRPRERGTR
jgi:AbiU2